MSRGTGRHEPGIDALVAAVREQQCEQPGRSARAALASRDLAEPGPPRPGRVSGRGGRLRTGSVPEPRTGPRADPRQGADHVVADHVVADHVTGLPTAPTETYALVQRAQSGDTDAFAELYDRYVDMVYRYVLYRIGSRPTAEDLTSETFLRALRKIDSFSWQGRDVGAWFVTIARNLVTDHYRSARYRLELISEDVVLEGAAPAVTGPEDEVLARLEGAALLAAVRRLTSEQQECIALRFLQGLSLHETAVVMSKNEASIKALQHRAVRSLGRLLSGPE